jgi:hypothetical protein
LPYSFPFPSALLTQPPMSRAHQGRGGMAHAYAGPSVLRRHPDTADLRVLAHQCMYTPFAVAFELWSGRSVRPTKARLASGTGPRCKVHLSDLRSLLDLCVCTMNPAPRSMTIQYSSLYIPLQSRNTVNCSLRRRGQSQNYLMRMSITIPLTHSTSTKVSLMCFLFSRGIPSPVHHTPPEFI